MSHSSERWDQGSRQKIWDRYCHFLDLNVEEFVTIQNNLLMEHLRLLSKSKLGQALMGKVVPNSPAEFRKTVPLTDYSFYEPFLADRREDALAVKPHDWVCTSGSGGVRKWVPITPGQYDALMQCATAIWIIATSTGRGNFSVRAGDTFFLAAPPPPYFSGFIAQNTTRLMGFNVIPPMDEEYQLSDLPERSARGFKMAMESGLDLIFALPGVMARVGEQLGQMKGSGKGRPPIRTLLRVLRGLLISRLAGRPLRPRDLWKLKLCFVTGMDLEAFRERIRSYWGLDPYEMYAQTEFGGMPAFQTWTRKAMTPQPYTSFFEFIPEGQSRESLTNPDYQPATVLLNELQAGQSYEVVFTNFYGGAFARFRPMDMITVVALEDAEAGIKLPQWVFKGRADKLIDLGGFTRIDERTIWQALEDAQIKYEDWAASKEAEREHPVLNIYIATDTREDPEPMKARLDASLRKYDSFYADLEDMLGWRPLRLTLLPLGVFARWQQERVADGADPAFIKEQRMQPPAEAIQRILELSEELREQ